MREIIGETPIVPRLKFTMENEQTKENEKERITLEYTAKGLANWTISVKEATITEDTIKRLKELDAKMRDQFQVNVMNGVTI
jgi:hypothetical protein